MMPGLESLGELANRRYPSLRLFFPDAGPYKRTITLMGSRLSIAA